MKLTAAQKRNNRRKANRAKDPFSASVKTPDLPSDNCKNRDPEIFVTCNKCNGCIASGSQRSMKKRYGELEHFDESVYLVSSEKCSDCAGLADARCPSRHNFDLTLEECETMGVEFSLAKTIHVPSSACVECRKRVKRIQDFALHWYQADNRTCVTVHNVHFVWTIEKRQVIASGGFQGYVTETHFDKEKNEFSVHVCIKSRRGLPYKYIDVFPDSSSKDKSFLPLKRKNGMLSVVLTNDQLWEKRGLIFRGQKCKTWCDKPCKKHYIRNFRILRELAPIRLKIKK